MKISFYSTASGRSPVWDYLHGLERGERARIFDGLAQIEAHGFGAVKVRFRQIEGKLWEIKVSAHRVFYVVVEPEEIILLHAYKKQGQKLPPREREVALKRMKEVLS